MLSRPLFERPLTLCLGVANRTILKDLLLDGGYRRRRDQTGRGDGAVQVLNWKSATAAAARIQPQVPDALEVLSTPGASRREIRKLPSRARVLNS